MKLQYRGATYDYNPPQAQTVDHLNRVAPAPAVGYDVAYRGSHYTVKPDNQPIHHILCQPIMQLFYRGAAYRFNECAVD